jgi:D-alanyl-D-alanine carboxypeptidase/D-alanyl-D-alanine-endopeptidase (penicillin-binding protein 4)
MGPLSKRLALCCALVWHAACAAAQPDIPPALKAKLEEFRVPDAHVGLYVTPVDDSEAVASLNPRQPFNPASAIKLLPALAALEILTPAYQWYTDVFAAAPIRDGVLEGDLFIQGGGDPYLTVESAWTMLKDVYALGIRRIAGDIVVDDAIFNLPPHDRGSFDDKPYRVYNGPAGGLMLNFWSVRFTISALGGTVHIDAFPASGHLEIVNRVKYSDGPCSRKNRYVGFRVAQSPGKTTVTFTGSLSGRCRPVVLTRAVVPTERYAQDVLPGLWRDAGGTLDGAARAGRVPANARRLVRHPSRSLGEVVRATNKFSNNMMARHLLITLGALERDKHLEVVDGIIVLQDWLQSKGIDVPGLNVINGSGLSRDARISALGLANVMRAGVHSRYAPEFLASLPLAGEDWALANRNLTGGDGTVVRLKTGLIDHVRAMAAYVRARSGRTYIAVLLVNHPGAHRGLGTRLQDGLIEYLLKL